MAVFVGTHINRIDRKGRVSVPAPFRNALGDPAPQGIYVMRSIRGVPALDAFSQDTFARRAEAITDPFAAHDDDINNAIFGASVLLGFDAEGRIMLPESFRSFAGIDDQVCFIGRGVSFQIWEPTAGLKHQEAAIRRAAEQRGIPASAPAGASS